MVSTIFSSICICINKFSFHKDNAIMSFLVSPKFMVMSTLGYYLQPVYNVAQIVLCSYMVWGLGANVQVMVYYK
eukprot:Pgem_evm1s4213